MKQNPKDEKADFRRRVGEAAIRAGVWEVARVEFSMLKMPFVTRLTLLVAESSLHQGSLGV